MKVKISWMSDLYAMARQIGRPAVTGLMIIFAVALLPSCSRQRKADMLKDTQDSKYQVGQVWRYKTRPQEATSSFTVVKVESHPKLGTIVHISVDGLRVKNPHHASGYSETVSHMPMSEAALNQSIVQLLKDHAELPPYQAGYAEWRKGFDAGEMGVWSLPLSECIDAMEETLKPQ